MGTLTVRKLDEDVHLRIKFVAKQRGVSAEEAARQLLAEATQPAERLGDAIADFNKLKGLGRFELKRNLDPIEPAVFE